MNSVGFVGLGNIGSLMCKRLLHTGLGVVACDKREEAMIEMANCGAEVERTPKSVADRADIVLLSLPSSKQVEEVIFGVDGLLSSERHPAQSEVTCFTIIDLSTSNPLHSQEMAKRLNDKGIAFLDAPVSGGLMGASKGELTVMVGGTETDFLRCRPILSLLGESVIHVGDVGSGHTVKAINNLMTAINLASAAEAMAIGMRLGVDPARILEVVNHSSGRSAASELKFPKILEGDSTVGFTVNLMNKDIDIALELARGMGIPTFISSTARQMWTLAGENWGDRDHTEVVRAVEQIMGVRFST